MRVLRGMGSARAKHCLKMECNGAAKHAARWCTHVPQGLLYMLRTYGGLVAKEAFIVRVPRDRVLATAPPTRRPPHMVV